MASFAERITGALQADVRTFEEIEADPTAINQAVAVIVIAGVASLIGNIWRIGVMGGVMMLVANLCGYALWALLVVLIGTRLMPEPTTKADFNEGFRVVAASGRGRRCLPYVVRAHEVRTTHRRLR